MQVLALMGFHVSPVGSLSPPRQLQEPIGAIQTHCLWGEQLVITLFSLFSVYRGCQVGAQQGANCGDIICGPTVDFAQL